MNEQLCIALEKEITLQKGYLDADTIDTIYFGGGTPSLLSSQQVVSLLNKINLQYPVSPNAEVTLEANPDDLSIAKLEELLDAGINRLSIGIQSFDDEVLKFLHRAHNVMEAEKSVLNARAVGFHNVSIDLIYAIPGQSADQWASNLAKAVALKPSHISAYGLTVEERTVFGRWKTKGTFAEVSEAEAASQFELMMEVLGQHGFGQYEISNFAQPGYRSKHNSSYWSGAPYLGIGPSAHSYNGSSRQYNVANNSLYIKKITQDIIPFERELLSRENQINEYIFTSLRTVEGCSLSKLLQKWGYDLLIENHEVIQQLRNNQLIDLANQVLYLTRKGKLVADQIAVELFAAEAL